MGCDGAGIGIGLHPYTTTGRWCEKPEFGKYLSPRLLVSYGVSLLGNGQVVGLSYQLRSNLEVEVESGLEQSAALKWRLER